MRRQATLGWLALGHGLNDFIAGYLLGNLAQLGLAPLQAAICFLLYNVIAFGGQYFAAVLLRQFDSLRLGYVLSWLLNILALACFFVWPLLAFVIAGCASALYHVAGGCWAAQTGKAAPVGLFAAPGILGLAAAGYCAWQNIDCWWLLFFATVIFLLAAFVLDWGKRRSMPPPQPAFEIDPHDALMIVLLSVIALRSAVWNIFQMLHQEQWNWLLAIACSAFAGKILGGYISDIIGWRIYNLGSLMIAAPLVSFFREELGLFCLGIALLQSGIPANTALLVQAMAGQKEKAVALSLGVAVFMAGALSTAFYFLGIDLSLLLPFLGLFACSFWLLKKRKKSIAY